MFTRLLNPFKENSFFLFGARGTGKTHLLKTLLQGKNIVYIDLLNGDEEYRFNRDPGLLQQRLSELKTAPEWVFVDEVQRAPKLLDSVHQLIESSSIQFALTGSSARKLKRGGANLLAGRAFVFHLFPLSYLELGADFSLNKALHWGALPKVWSYNNDESKELFLTSYANTYLKEEIVAEQLVRNVTPFRRFLEVAAQSNGEIINYSSIARDLRVDDSTVRTYFDILEDTLVGFRLPACDKSFRKQQAQSPKFYLFDLGVKRALENFSISRINEGSSAYGRAFEHFIILECQRLNEYRRKKLKFSYLRTKDGLEVDLIVEKPGGKMMFMEIKSTNDIHKVDVTSVSRIARDVKNAEAWVICREKHAQIINGVRILPWKEALTELFEIFL